MVSAQRKLEILRLHTDPLHGSRYWIEKAQRLGLGAAELAADPLRAPLLAIDELRGRPLADFLPRHLRETPTHLITGETSGFSGRPVVSCFTAAEFDAAFVTPFVRVAEQVGFPLRTGWLWAGPSGPHIIGKAVRRILEVVGGWDPFAVDFDPRWFRRLPAGSVSQQRYFEHLREQILAILEVQQVEVLFSTPPVVAMLAETLDAPARARFRGVHYGGMAMSPAQFRQFQAAFPAAVHLSGYGNSLFGMFPQTGFSDAGLEYALDSDRLEVAVVQRQADGSLRPCAVGETGNVLFSRYDESCCILNLLEADVATRLAGGLRHPHREQAQLHGRLIY